MSIFRGVNFEGLVLLSNHTASGKGQYFLFLPQGQLGESGARNKVGNCQGFKRRKGGLPVERQML
jgi:hypothetical protein